MTAVKICGITRADDGVAALAAGADALGFVLAEGSPRRLAEDAAAALVAEIRAAAGGPFLAVAVLGAYDADAARAALALPGIDRVQIVGADDDAVSALARTLGALGPLAARAWGAIRVRDARSLCGAETLACEAVHVDAHRAHALGGTGQAFDWSLATALAAARRVVLAGGLTPGNVGTAVRAVRPWRVDVSSGVESAPGVKDREAMRAFVEAVRHGDER